MVDVTVTPDEVDGDRGQMLLIAAFGLAVMLVALALVLNTAIYTENIATRGSDIVGGKDAAQYRVAVAEAGAGIVTSVNYDNNSSDYATLHAETVTSLGNWNNGSGIMNARFATVSNTSVVRTSNGTRIYQLDGGNFTNETAPNGDHEVGWSLFGSAADVDDVRNFTLTVDNSSLAQVGVSLSGSLGTGDVFYLQVNGSASGTRKVRIYNSVDGKFVVEVLDGGGLVGTCTRSLSDGEANVSVTNASVEGQRCEHLEFLDQLAAPYELSFHNSVACDVGCIDTIAGDYGLVVNNSSALTTTGDFAKFDETGHPGITPAVYSVTVEFTYRGPRLLYSTRVRVAPGEQDG